jgi:hypothetical protein
MKIEKNNNNKRKKKKGIAYNGLSGVLLGLSAFANPVSVVFTPAFVLCSIIYLDFT